MGSKYMDIITFREKYPLKEKFILAKGVYGQILDCKDDKYIIKKQLLSEPFIKELAFYNFIDHPNIPKIKKFTTDKKRYGYLLMKRGTNVRKALRDGEISFKNLIIDVFSTFTFLAKNGLVHCDLKVDNCIVRKGRFMLIDFGLTKSCHLYHNEYFFNGIAFSGTYKDPCYNGLKLNSIKTELFSIAAFFYFLFHPRDETKHLNFNFNFLYNRPFLFNSLKEIDLFIDLMNQCQKDLSDRDSILNLTRHDFFKNENLVDGVVTTQKYLPKKECFQKLEEICCFSHTHHLESRTVFMCLDMINQLCSLEYSVNWLICMYISSCVVGNSKDLTKITNILLENSCNVLSNESIEDDFLIATCSEIDFILEKLDGNIMRRTQWDFCKYEEEYPYLIKSMTQYESDYIIKIDLDNKYKEKDIIFRISSFETDEFKTNVTEKMSNEFLTSMSNLPSQDKNFFSSLLPLNLKNIDYIIFYYSTFRNEMDRDEKKQILKLIPDNLKCYF